ncbi:MAG: hypothetical protein ISS23_01835 [Nanoarchaeota archaeon]|nr:hypothetical protein [Nanoarchaeota archaeon]
MKKGLLILTLLFLISILYSYAYEETLPAGDDTKTDLIVLRSSSSITTTYYDKLGINPIVKIASLKYEPYPVEPGSYFDLWLRLDNLGDEEAKNVEVTFIPQGPFTISGASKHVIGKLGGRESAVVKFENIGVSENAIEGHNELKFEINMGGGYALNPLTSGITVEIRSVEPLFEITVDTKPEKIPQGGIADINVNLKNTDTSLLKDILVELDLPDNLIPVGSTVLKKIQKINPGSQETLTFTVTASGDATSKAHQIPLIVRYSDETGYNYSQSDTMGLLVGVEPDYYINLEESDTFRKGSNGEVVLSISNTGPADIKFLTIELLPSDGFVVLSNSKTYVGNLEPDDYETAEFNIYAKKSGDIPLNIELTYRDNYNMKHVTTHAVKLHSYNSLELRKYGLAKKSNRFNIIIYILTIIFIYLTYKNWKKEKDIVKAGKISFKTMVKGFFKLLGKIRWRYIKRIPRKIRLFIHS